MLQTIILLPIPLTYYLSGNNRSVLVQMIVWRQRGGKPFIKQMIAWLTEAYMIQTTSTWKLFGAPCNDTDEL